MAKKAGCDSFRPGPMRVQYMDYQRCALTAGMTLKPHTDNTAKLMCIVNPTNPTGFLLTFFFRFVGQGVFCFFLFFTQNRNFFNVENKIKK